MIRSSKSPVTILELLKTAYKSLFANRYLITLPHTTIFFCLSSNLICKHEALHLRVLMS
jgi:hypothetical protein